MYKIISPNREQTVDKEYIPNHNVVQIYLAGSIENDKSKKWREDVAERIYTKLKSKANGNTMPAIVFYNPIREDKINKELEEEQIEWQQFRILHSDYIFMYIQSDDKDPISLLEFGESVTSYKLFTCCDKDFDQFNNLRATSRQFNSPFFNNVDDGIDALVKEITK